MKRRFEVEEDRGVSWIWDDIARMECRFEGKDVVIYANKEALESMVTGLLSLAKNEVREWASIDFQADDNSENGVEVQKRVDFTTEVNH